MGLISSSSVIRCLSLFHLTLAYYLLASPSTLAEQNLVFVLGEAMHLPQVDDFYKPTHATAFAAAILAFLAVADFTAVSLPEEIGSHYWSSQAPVRLLFMFALCGYTYMFKPVGLAGMVGVTSKGFGEELKNSLVFTWGFLEMAIWFWIFILLRDERRQTTNKIAEKKRAEREGL